MRTAVVEGRAHLRMRRKGNRGTRPPQDEEVFLRLGLILRCEAIAEPRRRGRKLLRMRASGDENGWVRVDMTAPAEENR